jgi:myxalamid-type polyketide synthase MxaE and MxaD
MLILAQAPAGETIPALSMRKMARRWIILADESGVGAALDGLLKNSGEQCTILRCPHSASEFEAAFSQLQNQAGDGTTIEVIYLGGLDVGETIGSAEVLAEDTEVCGKTLIHLIQRLLTPENHAMHLWMVTRGAQATESFSPSAGGAAQSLAWGVGRVLGLEAPEQYRALIDLDPAQTSEAAAQSLLGELLTDDLEDQIAYRHGQRLVARLKNSSLKDSTVETAVGKIHKDGSYLLVGGLGGLGLRLARWVAEQRPGHLVLLGRTGTGSNAGAFAAQRLNAIEEMKKLGVDVTVVEGDVASEPEMTRLFRRFGDEFLPLKGVFHIATAIHGAELVDLTDEQIETMLRPKVLGTWVLHELTKNLNLDFFLAFSSAASLLGAKGLAHYAAANQFMDSFAYYRRAVGLPMLAVNWGAWEVMRLASLQGQSRFSETGLLPMSTEKLLNVFPELIASCRAQIMIANVDWNVLKPVLEANRVRPMLDGFGKIPSKLETVGPISVPRPVSLHRTIGMMPEERRKFIEVFVQEQAARVLGFRGGDLPPVEVPLTDIGLDSLMAVDLKNRLQTGLGQELSPTIVFDYPTVSGMVGLMETMLWAAHVSTEDDLASSQKDEIRI